MQTEITKLKDWKNQLKFELIPLFWPTAFYTEDTPSVEVLVEEVKKLLLVKEQIENEKDNYRDKYDGVEEELREKVRAYYHLNPQEELTDNQINEYLYREAIGNLTAPTENPNQESNKLTVALIIGGVSLLILFAAVVINRIRLKRK